MPIIKINIPSHLPKINPAKRPTGKPNPAITTQTIVESIKIEDNKNKLACLNPKK